MLRTNKIQNVAGTAEIDIENPNTAFNKDFGDGADEIMQGSKIFEFNRNYNQHPIYRWQMEGGSDLAWKTIATVVMGNTAAYQACSMRLEYFNPNSNYGYVTNAIKNVFYLSMTRSGTVIDDLDTAQIYGTDISGNKVRIVKTSIGNYQVQVNQELSYKSIAIKCQVTTTGSITTTVYDESPTTGSSTGVIYYPTYNNEVWYTPSLLNGWISYSGDYRLGYFKDLHNVVHFHVRVINGTTAAGTVIFTLPVGYRPDKNTVVNLVGVSGTESELMHAVMYTNGNVSIFNCTNLTGITLIGTVRVGQ